MEFEVDSTFSFRKSNATSVILVSGLLQWACSCWIISDCGAEKSMSEMGTRCITMPYFGLWTVMPSNALFQLMVFNCFASSSLLQCIRTPLPFVSLLTPCGLGFVSSVDPVIACWHRSVISFSCIDAIWLRISLVARVVVKAMVSLAWVFIWLGFSCSRRFWAFVLASCRTCACSDGGRALIVSAPDLTGLIAVLISLRSFPSVFKFDCCNAVESFFVSVLILRTSRSRHWRRSKTILALCNTSTKCSACCDALSSVERRLSLTAFGAPEVFCLRSSLWAFFMSAWTILKQSERVHPSRSYRSNSSGGGGSLPAGKRTRLLAAQTRSWRICYAKWKSIRRLPGNWESLDDNST